MGRTKGSPQRRDGAHEFSEVLGRQTENESVESLLARELLPNDIPALATANEPLPLIARPQRNQKSSKPKKKTKKRSVTMAGEETESISAAAMDVKGEVTTRIADDILHIQCQSVVALPSSSALLMRNKSSSGMILRSVSLEHNVEIHCTGQSASSQSLSPYIIQTRDGARTVWKILCEYSSKQSPPLLLSNDSTVVDQLVEKGLVQLQLFPERNEVAIVLSEMALEYCSPAQLPLHRVVRAKKYQPAGLLWQFLATLFPDSIVSDRTLESSSKLITAHHVYNLTDNRQYQKYLEKNYDDRHNKSERKRAPREIPGLVPTLRPYQQAAVEWMMERETKHNNETNEWMLGWVVATPNNGALVPLLRCSNNSNDNSTIHGVFLCPFAGWLAKDWQQAKMRTLFKKNKPVQGGILAESMGLGKTVEMLACILANPRKSLPTKGEEGIVRRSLFGKSDLTVELSSPGQFLPKSETVVEDYNEFGEADDDDSSREETMKNGNNSKFLGSLPVVVTPEKPVGKEESVNEEWIEDSLLGSCICGSLITFEDLQRPVVICCQCREPMHMHCAGFENQNDLEQQTDVIAYRRLYLNTSATARLSRTSSCCPCCVCDDENGIIESRASLIVTPTAILSQWEEEIARHTKMSTGSPLSVVVYRGVHQITSKISSLGKSPDKSVQLLHPSRLAAADVVLAPLDALMSDLSHPLSLAPGEARAQRKRKRYRVVPSPLLKIQWWRVCLDEAQRVETPTAKSAQMALKLSAVHRWCVSGTPVGRGKLEDLFGLLLFLGFAPFDSKAFFDKCFISSVRGIDQRIIGLLDNVFWRSTRAHPQICEEMGIPEQEEKKVFLEFSSIERHFYKRQLEATLSVASEISEKTKRSGRKMGQVVEHLHTLRAACCHPQVGSGGLKQRREAGSSLSSQVMSMHQILCRLIDDARLKCEEAQRLAIMHTNAAAALTNLKVEANVSLGVPLNESNKDMFQKSFNLYSEALDLGKENATPTLVLGDATISGSRGFQSPQSIINRGHALLEWISSCSQLNEGVWARFDFETARRITEVRVRSSINLPQHVQKEKSQCVHWHVVLPHKVVLQASNSAYGGEFVDVATILYEKSCSEWKITPQFLANKSKNWRIKVETDAARKNNISSEGAQNFLGIEVELFEASVGLDPLQRLHCLHNASKTVELMTKEEEALNDALQLRAKIMTDEASSIKSLYMEERKSAHKTCRQHLHLLRNRREDAMSKLRSVSPGTPKDVWEDNWYDDFLVMCQLHAPPTISQQMVDRLRQQLDSSIRQGFGHSFDANGIVPFQDFHDLAGLRLGLQFRTRDVRTGIGRKPSSRAPVHESEEVASSRQRDYFRCPEGGFAECMKTVGLLSDEPSEHMVIENRCCRVCKADWNQTGPECRHCKLGVLLDELEVDKVTMQILRALHGQYRWMKDALHRSRSEFAGDYLHLEERAAAFFDALECERKERNVASRLWRIHLDLLNDLDELNQCMTTIRLVHEGEDLLDMTADELNAVVHPFDIDGRYHEHSAKQAMALGDLRRALSTLKYLRNQSEASSSSDGNETCMVCLSDFSTSERAVLKCGHSFHHTPCLENLRSASGEICCPLRCRVRTKYTELLIASEKRKDDGSSCMRNVKGSWGTKVTKLISDVLDVRDRGEKCIVFSQWDDMLDICEAAMQQNGIYSSRSKSAKALGSVLQKFRSEEGAALLLNVKSAGEGLTVVEATHVFLVEPLLNHGLDSQAIARINRIGQTRKTVVHRYLIKDTVEVKIDRLRESHSSDEVEDSLSATKRSSINAGGIDGGFNSTQELLELLS